MGKVALGTATVAGTAVASGKQPWGAQLCEMQPSRMQLKGPQPLVGSLGARSHEEITRRVRSHGECNRGFFSRRGRSFLARKRESLYIIIGTQARRLNSTVERKNGNIQDMQISMLCFFKCIEILYHQYTSVGSAFLMWGVGRKHSMQIEIGAGVVFETNYPR